MDKAFLSIDIYCLQVNPISSQMSGNDDSLNVPVKDSLGQQTSWSHAMKPGKKTTNFWD